MTSSQAAQSALFATPSSHITIFCDGACSGNPGVGGWGCIVEYDGQREEYFGGLRHTTNNQMELQALIEALKNAPRERPLKIVTDSEYLAKGVTQWMKGWIRNGWKTASKQPVKNQELWREINLLLLGREYSFEWVKGHSGHEENERCDELAREAISRVRKDGKSGPCIFNLKPRVHSQAASD